MKIHSEKLCGFKSGATTALFWACKRGEFCMRNKNTKFEKYEWDKNELGKCVDQTDAKKMDEEFEE